MYLIDGNRDEFAEAETRHKCAYRAIQNAGPSADFQFPCRPGGRSTQLPGKNHESVKKQTEKLNGGRCLPCSSVLFICVSRHRTGLHLHKLCTRKTVCLNKCSFVAISKGVTKLLTHFRGCSSLIGRKNPTGHSNEFNSTFVLAGMKQGTSYISPSACLYSEEISGNRAPTVMFAGTILGHTVSKV